MYISIEAVQFLPMLGHNSTDNITNGDHADHAPPIYHWDVPDTVIFHHKPMHQLQLTPGGRLRIKGK